jgi:hypothetical protein
MWTRDNLYLVQKPKATIQYLEGTDADFFTVEPVRTVTFTESEFEQGHKNWYRQGYENGREGKPKKSLK